MALSLTRKTPGMWVPLTAAAATSPHLDEHNAEWCLSVHGSECYTLPLRYRYRQPPTAIIDIHQANITALPVATNPASIIYQWVFDWHMGLLVLPLATGRHGQCKVPEPVFHSKENTKWVCVSSDSAYLGERCKVHKPIFHSEKKQCFSFGRQGDPFLTVFLIMYSRIRTWAQR